jgi:hypothetical protein
MDDKYYIIRNYFADGMSGKVMDKGLTLEQAQAHCKDPQTSSSTHSNGRNGCKTDWFDGYEKM